MTLLRLPVREAKYLSSFPESGMGFQVIELGLMRRTRALYLVVGGRFLIPASDPDAVWRTLSALEGWTAERLETSEEVEDTRLIDGPMGNYSGPAERPSLRASLLDPGVRWSEQGRALLRVPEVVRPGTSGGPRRYVRYSPFELDPRVLTDGSLAAGSYAVPDDDPERDLDGAAPGERYALPTPLLASRTWAIVTSAAPSWVGGSVANFGRVGGGTQAFFKARVVPEAGGGSTRNAAPPPGVGHSP
ncbi:MAG TPA: hypothetical protein VGA70_12385 [Longimicrobiales bacterium]|jgi:hypothetical protein